MHFSEDILIKRQYGLSCVERVINCSHACWQSLGLECVNLLIFLLTSSVLDPSVVVFLTGNNVDYLSLYVKGLTR